jgi:hypothetical protein
MTQVLKEEKFTEDDWDDVFHIGIATFKWLSENVKTDAQLIAEGKIPPPQLVSSHTKTKQQKD